LVKLSAYFVVAFVGNSRHCLYLLSYIKMIALIPAHGETGLLCSTSISVLPLVEAVIRPG